MFNKPTVFVLGAGASWHYGFPTGEKLVNDVIVQAKRFADLCASFAELCASPVRWAHAPIPAFMLLESGQGNPLHENHSRWLYYSDQASQLAARLEQVNPTLIDYFLAHNERLQLIGKFVIASVILGCERRRSLQHYNSNRLDTGGASKRLTSDDWLKFIINELTSRCDSSEDILKNQVSFITFNYDTSLEWRISSALRNLQYFEEIHVAEFMSHSRFIHVYGKIDSESCNFEAMSALLTSSIVGRSRPDIQETVNAIQRCYEMSTGIRTIHGNEKLQGAGELALARNNLKDAEIIYILGYGFDGVNSERIGLDSALQARPEFDRSIMFTNFGGSNRVTKAASRLMGIPAGDLFATTPPLKRDLHIIAPYSYSTYWEMSTKDVYNALAWDFEALEKS